MKRIFDFFSDQAERLDRLEREIAALKAEVYQSRRPSRAVPSVPRTLSGTPEGPDSGTAEIRQAERATPAESASVSAPAPAPVRAGSPEEKDRKDLAARMRNAVKGGTEKVAVVRKALAGGMVVRPSDVKTWAEYDALVSLFDSIEC